MKVVICFLRNISSTDSYLVGTLGVGEGWHNYHHVSLL